MARSTDKGQTEYIEDAGTSPSKLSRGQRFKRHCGRRWWIYLIVFLLVAVGVICGIIFGAIPSIAQKSVNESSLEVDGIAITNPSNERFTLDMNSTVHAHAPLSAHFSPQTFEMYLPPADGQEIVPFMTLSVGQLQVEDTFTINVTGEATEILNKDAYDAFSAQVLGLETLELGVRSNPQLNVGSIKFNVDYNKVVPLRGLNGLRGITLHNASILNETLEDGTNMIVDGIIPNPSSFTLQCGDLTVDTSVAGQALGYAVIKDLTLRPGDNHVKISQHIPPETLERGRILIEFTLGAPNTEVTLTANSTVYNGQHISWLEKPLREAGPVIAIMNPE